MSLKKLQELHDTYKKHQYENGVCITCLKGVEKLCYLGDTSIIRSILRKIPYTAQEIAESGIIMSWTLVECLFYYYNVDWDKVEKIITTNLLSRDRILTLLPRLSNKVYVERAKVTSLKGEIDIKYILNIESSGEPVPMIHKYLKENAQNFFVYNCVNLSKANFWAFVKHPNLFCHAFVPLKFTEKLISMDKRYIAFMYPRAYLLYKQVIDKIPNDIIDLIQEIDQKLNLKRREAIPYEKINTYPTEILGAEIAQSKFYFKGRCNGVSGIVYSFYPHAVDTIELLGYCHYKERY